MVKTLESFQPVEKKAVTNVIIEQIAAQVRGGELQPGDRLPSEQQLAERLGVGRSSVREAFKALEILGVIERTNEGTRITKEFPQRTLSKFLSAELVTRSLEVSDVYTARRVLQVELSVMAAQVITGEEVDRLEGLCDEMEAAAMAGSEDEYVQKDQEFHLTIAQIAGNAILERMWQLSYDLFRELRRTVPSSEKFLGESNASHRALCEAFRKKDPALVRRTVEGSMKLGERHITEKMKDLAPGE